MPRNEKVEVKATPVQLTAVGTPVERVFLFNEGPASITIAGSATDQEPPMVGPVIQPGMALPVTMPLADIFPGVPGVSRLFGVAGVGGASVFVSHA